MISYNTIDEARADKARAPKATAIWECKSKNNGDVVYFLARISFAEAQQPYCRESVRRELQTSGLVLIGGHDILTTGERKIADKIDKDKQEIVDNTVTIYLSSRGWGDFSPLEWAGDIRKPDADIMDECKKLLQNGYDVDMPNIADDELINKINQARIKHLTPKVTEAETTEDRGNGYCYSCETYCYGDCGEYAPRENRKTFGRKMIEAGREQNFGISENA